MAGVCWIAAAGAFASLPEAAGATGGGGDALRIAREHVSLLREDPQLARFIAARALLMGTALAPPYFLTISGRVGGQSVGALGPFVLASSFASVASSYVWGRLSDRSSRRVLIYTGLAGAAVLSAVALLPLVAARVAASPYVLAAALLGLMIAYHGVRQGRSTHIVDMAPADQRAAYTALSNTIIGVMLVLGGAFGFVSDIWGPGVVLGIFALMCLAAAWVALGLNEVQGG